MAEDVVVGQFGLNIASAPQRLLVALGPLGIALTVEEAKGVLAQFASAIAQVEHALIIATPDQLPPLNLNGHG